MKKSEAVTVVYKYVKTLENSKITKKQIEHIIELLQGLGMEPPVIFDIEDDEFMLNEWEKE